MTMKTIGIIGAFDFVGQSTGGQPVKTRQLYESIAKDIGKENVICVDTQSWKKHIITILIKLIPLVLKSDIIIMLPATNGIKVITKILLFAQKIGKEIYYDVIGGWLPSLLNENSTLLTELSSFDGIFVETETMNKQLKQIGLNNCKVVPNYKRLNCVDLSRIKEISSTPYSLCTFSRVMEQKGIGDIIYVVDKINKKQNRICYKLDIYGPIDKNYENEFEEIISRYSSFISYKGIVDPSKSVETVQNYFALIFPTRFFTEGVPGTIIDAYAAGVPVIASEWESCRDVVKDNVTGLIYRFEDVNDLERILIDVLKSPQKLNSLKGNCIQEYSFYSEECFRKKIAKIIGIRE